MALFSVVVNLDLDLGLFLSFLFFLAGGILYGEGERFWWWSALDWIDVYYGMR